MALTQDEIDQVVVYLQEKGLIGGPVESVNPMLNKVHVPTAESVGLSDFDELDTLLEESRSEQPAYKYLFDRGIYHRNARKLIDERKRALRI